MLNIVNMQEIENNLMQVPGMIRMYETDSPGFSSGVKSWLIQLEKTLEANRLYACSEIAVLRGRIISAEKGVIPENIKFSKQKSHRKTVEAVAFDMLRQASELASGILKGPALQIDEAEKYMKQVVAVAERKGLMSSENSGIDRSGFLGSTWKRLVSDAELGAVCTHIRGLVSSSDVLILLDRALAGYNPAAY
ncbi:MAG TPA: hypothetical protein VHT96_16445 [Clostridia bacterium]|nr:hypothetical protein [Clostridia bacterium]